MLAEAPLAHNPTFTQSGRHVASFPSRSATQSPRSRSGQSVSRRRGRDEHPPRWLDEEGLGKLLGDLPDRRLLGTIDEEGGFRISLAGAQDKVGILLDGERIGNSL
jgi:hypothetical protein